jgi:hypothetical protein
MMTDDRIDARLREAGERWRAAQPPLADPDPTRLTWKRPTRRLAPVAVAAGLVAVLAGAAIVASTLSRETGPPGGPTTSPDRPTDPASPLLVHDGDTVEAVGSVITPPTGPARLCVGVSHPVNAPVTKCAHGVDLRGAVTEGYAKLRGTWNRGVLTVTEKLQPTKDDVLHNGSSWAMPDLPCSPPPGGWRPTPGTTSTLDKGYLEQHGDRFGVAWTFAPPNHPMVMVVEVVSGDLESAHQELAQIYAGNLCVTQGRYSLAEKRRVADALFSDPTNGVFLVGSGLPGRKAAVSLVVIDERVYANLSKIGFDGLELYPAVRPVR